MYTFSSDQLVMKASSILIFVVVLKLYNMSFYRRPLHNEKDNYQVYFFKGLLNYYVYIYW